MTSIPHCISTLEAYIERSGAHLSRAALPECIHGRMCRDRITLRTDLSPKQELVALVHELTHWLAHRDARSCMDCTIFEYEAEAVEALVMARLGLPHATVDPGAFECASPTDNLLSASVARAEWASARICGVLGVAAQTASETQAPVDLEAAAGKEIVLEYEQHGVSNLLGSPEAL